MARRRLKEVKDVLVSSKIKRKALAKRGVKEAYDALDDEFAFLDEVLKARVSLA